MDETNQIHLLTRELIPIIGDTEPETKEIVMNHIATCKSCQMLYAEANELDHIFPEKRDESVEIKPLKKLVQFNKGIKILLIMIRVAILSYAIYSGIVFSGFIKGIDVYLHIQSIIYVLYLPASLFLLVFTFVFLSKRWLIYSIVVDLMIVFGLDFIFKLLFFS